MSCTCDKNTGHRRLAISARTQMEICLALWVGEVTREAGAGDFEQLVGVEGKRQECSPITQERHATSFRVERSSG